VVALDTALTWASAVTFYLSSSIVRQAFGK
jgi:hypothetical protein